MKFKNKIKNIFEDIKYLVSKYDYILGTIIILIIWIVCKEKIKIDNNLIDRLINISSVFIGFLITIHTIILSLPKENKFMKQLEKYGYFKEMYLKILLGELGLMICLITSLLEIGTVIAPLTFMLGLMYTVLLSKTFFMISFNN